MADIKFTVLAVDDVSTNLQILNTILRDKYFVKVATSGLRAIQIAASLPSPDIILLDLIMPEMDGHEVCRKLKLNDITKHIPVIFLTAKSSLETEQECRVAGAVDYICKPVNPSVLWASLSKHLTP